MTPFALTRTTGKIRRYVDQSRQGFFFHIFFSLLLFSVPWTEFDGSNMTKKHYPCEFIGPAGTEMAGNLIEGIQTIGCHYVPNAYLMSVLLFIGTFLISWHLKKFKFGNFFTTSVRNFVSDFAVLIAILSMTMVDMYVGVDTPKLKVPGELRPTWSGRGWVIPPFGSNPWWTSIVAILPALLATILIFMDQQITAVIVNRKEHKLLVSF